VVARYSDFFYLKVNHYSFILLLDEKALPVLTFWLNFFIDWLKD